MAIATKPSFIPTLKKATVATPVASVVAPVVAEPETVQEITEESVMSEVAETAVAPVEEKKVKAPKRERTTEPNREMERDDMEFVVANIKTMSYGEMAEARGITKHQVNRVLMTAKQQMRDYCVTSRDAEGKALTYDEDSLAKVNAYIAENLSRPEGSGPGRGKSSAVKEGITSITDNILANILNSVK